MNSTFVVITEDEGLVSTAIRQVRDKLEEALENFDTYNEQAVIVVQIIKL